MGGRVLGIKEEATYGVASDTIPDFHQEVEKAKASVNSEPMTYSGGSRMIKKAKAGAMNPEASYDMKCDLKRIGHYMKAFLGNYVFTSGGASGNTHEFYGGENAALPSYTLWSTFDIFEKKLLGAVCETLKLEVGDEFMDGSTEWKYKTETKVDSVPDPADLLMIPDDILIAFYDIALELEGSAPPGIVSKFSFDGKNGLNVDKTRGLGSRGPQRKPKAQSRELKIEFESSLEPETIELIEKAEYGEVADSPSACKLYRLPLKLTIEFCEDANDSMEIYFPECIFSAEYEASGADEIDVKFNLQTIGSSIVTLLDGTTEVVTDMYVKLINNQPKIESGAVGTSTVTIGLTDLGDAISGAVVTLTNRATGAVINSSATSAGGAATLSTVPLGSYDVSVVSGTDTLDVTPARFSVNEATETLAITKNTSLVSVTLHDGETAVEGAVITLTDTVTEDTLDSGATSASGAASIDHVPYGSYDVSAVTSLDAPIDITPVTLIVDGAAETLTLLVVEE